MAPHAIGTSLFILPFYFLAAPLVQVLDVLKHAVFDTLHPLFFSFASAGMVCYYFLAGAVLLLALSRRFGNWPTVTGVSLIMWGTFLPAYAFARPLLSHVPDFLASSLLIWRLLLLGESRSVRRRDVLLLGVLSAATLVVRWQNLNLFLLGAAGTLAPIWSGKPLETARPRTTAAAVFALSAAGTFLLTQGAAWWVYLGRLFPPPWSWITPSVIDREGLRVWLPGGVVTDLNNLRQVFFGLDWGLAWTALPALAGWAGLLLLPMRPLGNRAGNGLNRLFLFLIVALPFVIVLRWREQGSAFGYRYFSGTLPLAAVGLTAVLKKAGARRIGRAAVNAAAAVLIAGTLLSLLPYRRFPSTEMKRTETPLGGYCWTNNSYLRSAAACYAAAAPGVRRRLLLSGYLGWFTRGRPMIVRLEKNPSSMLPLSPRLLDDPGKAFAVGAYPALALAFAAAAFAGMRRTFRKRDSETR
ncbi:MAG TPA: hypothetical protein PLZ73_11705 [bacterium]|nr:hypothetical protein [bacterium]